MYRLHTVGHLKDLWEQLMHCLPSRPWIVGGDFNSMFSVNAKLGRTPVRIRILKME